MSVREILNERSRKPVCWGVEVHTDRPKFQGFQVAQVVPVYPGDNLSEAIHRDAVSLSFRLYDTEAEAIDMADGINYISECLRESSRSNA